MRNNYWVRFLCMISGIIKVEVSARLITLTETLIIPDITKTKSNHCFIIHCFEINQTTNTPI